jgi:hypothetical protein
VGIGAVANAGVNLLLDTYGTSAVWGQSDVLVVLNYAALSFAVLVTVWGTERIARRVETLRAETSEVLDADASASFSALNSVTGPLARLILRPFGFLTHGQPKRVATFRRRGAGENGGGKRVDERSNRRERHPDQPVRSPRRDER